MLLVSLLGTAGVSADPRPPMSSLAVCVLLLVCLFAVDIQLDSTRSNSTESVRAAAAVSPTLRLSHACSVGPARLPFQGVCALFHCSVEVLKCSTQCCAPDDMVFLSLLCAPSHRPCALPHPPTAHHCPPRQDGFVAFSVGGSSGSLVGTILSMDSSGE